MKPTNWLAGTAAMALALQAMAASAQDAMSMDDLVAAATAEGMLTTIALPHDWCNYGAMIEGFKAAYPGIEINELNPNGSSADELEAIRANMNNTGPQAPDVVDVGLSFGPAAVAEGLLAPYKVSTWDSIPEDAKDADGYWYGDYYGVMSLVVNTDLVDPVPTSIADLMKPEYAGMIAVGGDPRTANNAAMAVMTTGLAGGAAPGADAAAKGLEFFAALNQAGNFVPVDASSGTIAQGTTPIAFDWDYNGLATRDSLAGNPPIEVVVPSDAVLSGMYVQAISAYAPHPNAAKLWMEYIYSDEGQTHWLSGYCHPIRFNDMASRGVLPQELVDALPPAENYERAVFPTLEQVEANAAAIRDGWDTIVGADIAAE